jgi:large subunit ribosomal protein L22
MIDEPTNAEEPEAESTEDAPAAEKAAPKKAAPKKAAAKPAAKKADKPAADAKTPEEKAAETKAAARSARTSGEVEARPVRAVAKYLRFSAQKGRLVVDQIRGKTITDAATLLAFGERAAAREVMKVLKSAVANPENNHGMSASELYVTPANVHEGPTVTRWKPRARGRADKINKRTCHVTVVVSTAPDELLNGRSGKKGGDRSARVAASRSAGPAKKAAPKKTSERKPAATKKAAAKPAEASTEATESNGSES